MKTFKLLLSLAVLAFVFASCQTDEVKTTLVDFENVELDSTGYWNGSDKSGTPKVENVWGSDVTNYYGSFESSVCNFSNVYTKEWNSWTGIACSSKKDSVSAGFMNQYSVYAATGATGSIKFGVVYGLGGIKCPANENGYFKAKSIMLANSTYSYLYMKKGDDGFGANSSKMFSADKWLKATITGFAANTQTASIDVYLADFRSGKSFISKNWEKVDITSLGNIDSLAIEIKSNDPMAPTYVCIDNIEFTQTISTK
jgi:hypothetical protein